MTVTSQLGWKLAFAGISTDCYKLELGAIAEPREVNEEWFYSTRTALLFQQSTAFFS